MNFDDQDWEIGLGRTDEARGGSGAWKLAAGVALGMVLGGMLVYGLGRLQARTEAATAEAPAARALERSLDSVAPPAAGLPPLPAHEAPASQAANEGSVPTPQPAPDAPAGAARPAPRPREPDAAARAAQRALERKESAWAAYYKKPARCDDNPSKDTMVECANHYIRAKREFEQAYAGASR